MCIPSFGLPAPKKTQLTNESEVSFPSSRRIRAYVRVVVLGVLEKRRAVVWAEKHGSSVALPRPSGIWQALYGPGKRCTLVGLPRV